MKSLAFFLIFLFVSRNANSQYPDCYPNQIHISLGDAYYNSMYNYTVASNNTENSSAIIIWQTTNNCSTNTLKVKQTNGIFSKTFDNYEFANSNYEEYVSDTSEGTPGEVGWYDTYIHSVALNNLVPGVNYSYTITSEEEDFGPYYFQLPDPNPVNNTYKFLIYADVDTLLGNQTLLPLGNLVYCEFYDLLYESVANQSAFDAQILIGDVAYNIFNDVGDRGEWFYNTIQRFSVTWPLMVTPGNHERYKNYTFLSMRTRMPLYDQSANQYFSFNVGKIHYLFINYDWYYDNAEFNANQTAMMDFIYNDLNTANATRNIRPWIIIVTHRPIYCSYSSPSDPVDKRCYSFYSQYEMFDEIYYNYRVDLVLQAHVHYWERMGPTYQNNSMPYYSPPDDIAKHYIINPQAPVYTLDGSAGNNYYMVSQPSNKFDFMQLIGPLESYSINYDLNVAFSTLTILNDSCLYYEHINSSNSEVIDYFYLAKGSAYPMPTPSSNLKIGSDTLLYIGIALVVLLAAGIFAWKKIRNVRQQAALKDTLSLSFNQGESPLDVNV